MKSEEETEIEFETALRVVYKSIKQFYIKERLSIRNMVYPPNTQLAVILLPIFVPFIYYFTTPHIIELNSTISPTIVKDNIILYHRLTLFIILGYLLTITFNSMIRNGQYGYWLALGIKRSRSLNTIIGMTTVYAITSGVVLTTLFSLATAVSFNLLEVLSFLIFSTISTIFFCAFSISLYELISSAQVSYLIILIFYTLFVVFADNDLIFRKVLIPELYRNSISTILFAFIQLILGFGMIFLAKTLHSERDIDLRG